MKTIIILSFLCICKFSASAQATKENWNIPYEISADIFDAVDSNSGNINLSVFGGVVPYTYLWSTGATTQDLAGIAAGDYVVTVTDKTGRMVCFVYTVNSAAPDQNLEAGILNDK
ncbi:MAG: SprB repeat-containing protein [Chitinophagales bacterium]